MADIIQNADMRASGSPQSVMSRLSQAHAQTQLTALRFLALMCLMTLRTQRPFDNFALISELVVRGENVYSNFLELIGTQP